MDIYDEDDGEMLCCSLTEYIISQINTVYTIHIGRILNSNDIISTHTKKKANFNIYIVICFGGLSWHFTRALCVRVFNILVITVTKISGSESPAVF